MKTKRLSHTYWHTKLDKKLGDWLRETFTECAMCHRQGYLQVSHILPKGHYPHLRYDPINILPMDGQCHQFKWHASPIESAEWFKKTYPQREVYLQEAKNLFIKRNEDYYRNIEKALNKKDIKSLMVLKDKI